ncbi:hypothetical protein COO91_05941 [Nostoc flagelliforme CCNUN1]|uniref:Uncharacterized protein n=1 Tax=Nostoc flagelliforme CCNUN1 TaxID=2038116 RepID=A0A2K8SYX4_9NOSO|nr:hypothetical protein COO91_05941 [Nostoc flagelliforme CCNUN1]
MGHPFPAGRYANGYAQGKWAWGIGYSLCAFITLIFHSLINRRLLSIQSL